MALYHESQEGKLCGVHTLNSLLQGPFFSEVDLAQIAHDLDAMERNFMAEGGVQSDDYLKFVAEESGNAALDGNFSIQVLSKALEVWGLAPVSLMNPEMAAAAAAPHREQAFICNLDEHWFTLRRVAGDWWDFNSIYPAPRPLGTLYLDAFLGTLRSQGYTIFVVKGELPEPSRNLEAASRGNWFTAAEAKAANDRATEIQARSQITEKDTDLAAALAASLSSAFASASGSVTPPAPPTAGGANGFSLGIEDEQLAKAIAASLAGVPTPEAEATPAAEASPTEPKEPVVCPRDVPNEPPPGPAVLEIGFRLPDGSRLQRRFMLDDTVGTISDFLLSSGIDMSKYQLGTAFPRRVLKEPTATLTEAKLGNKETLTVELKR